MRGKLIFYFSILAIVSAVAVASAGFGYKSGVWGLGTAFSIFRYGAYAAMGGAGLALIALIMGFIGRPKSWFLPLIGLIAAGYAAASPAMMFAEARKVPPIHDITTDMISPPVFIAAAEARKEGENSTDYAGEEIAAQQREAYPDIQPLILDLNTEAAYAIAFSVVTDAKYEILAADQETGRIEAMARTAWFGFKDDVVIRVQNQGDGRSRIDIRSASRVGMSDIGANAKRIRKLTEKIEKKAAS